MSNHRNKHSEAYRLRRRMAKYLAQAYIDDPVRIAEDCDTLIDPTGELLGMVREEAASARTAHSFEEELLHGAKVEDKGP